MEVFSALVKQLKKLNMTVAPAESCTAGLFSSRLAEVPGASDVLRYGFVVYAAEAKCRLLGVKPETIETCGVVSEETACEMACGAAAAAKADIGLGITGYAGPGADDGMPVGRVCFGYALCGTVKTETVEFGDIGRNAVRGKSAEHAAETLLLMLKASS